MSAPLIKLRAIASASSQRSSLLSWAIITCVVCSLSLSGCASRSSSSADEKKLAKERQRIEAERRAQRDASIRELLARNIPAETDSEEMWVSFRRAYPYNTQTLALSAQSPDGSRTLIVAEPPPHVNTGDILLPLESLLRNHSVKKQQIGYDGWVKDVVIELAGDEAKIDSAISVLNRLLFHTSYMSYVLPLPARAPGSASFNLDLQVTSAELKNWVVDAREIFTPVEGGDGLSLQALYEQKISGVFYGNGGGLVGWWIPKGRSIDDCRIQARQFSLDSDLIVGALSNPGGILVLGRERVVPVDLLPPLRVETLSLLAAVQQGQTGELKQSYERKHPFAGRIDGGKDWAPILLSPELRDTEYGSLLNITDQLLKGWSNNGNTSYYNFNYPSPKSWPFKGSLLDQLHTIELTYNWNTRGAGYTVDVDDYSLLALNRTGALPISYKPEENTGEESPAAEAAADDAYRYFAKLNDPNLVRVVQYAAMYQIFSAFDIAKPQNPVPQTSVPDEKLKELTEALMAEIRSASPDQLEELAGQLAPLVSAQRYDRSRLQRDVEEFMGRAQRYAEQQLKAGGYAKGSEAYKTKLRDYLNTERERVQGSIDENVAQDDRQVKSDIATQLSMLKAGQEANSEKDQSLRVLALSQLAGLRKLPERYAESVAPQSEGWIHTPALVISWNSSVLAGRTLIGGHNLDARVTRFRASDEVLAGRTRVDVDGTILVNPKDVNRVGKVVRTAGRAERESPDVLSSALDHALASTPATQPRTRANALSLPASPPLPPNGPPRPPFSTSFPGFDGEHWYAGWARGRGQLPAPEPVVALLSQRRSLIPGVVIVAREGDGIIRIAHSENSRTIEARNIEDATDAVVYLLRRAHGEQQLKIEFRGFQKHEAKGFVKSCEVRADSEKIPGEISGVVNESLAETARNGERGGGGGGTGEGNSGRGGSGESLLLIGRQRKYDFARAEVKVLQGIDVLPDGTQRSRIVVEVPALDVGVPKGRTDIELGFRKSTPREIVGIATRNVAVSVRNFVKGIRNEYDSVIFNFRLNREIKRVSKEMGVDVDLIRHSFNDGQGDLYFANREKRDEPATPDTATCQPA